MFLQIAASRGGANTLLRQPPQVLASVLDAVWNARIRGSGLTSLPMGLAPFRSPRILWDHLIWAYLTENSNIDRIMRQVTWEHLHGERLPTLVDPITYDWLRTTEQFFYSYGPPFLPSTTISLLRDRPQATRRNAYYRMFGADLNHGDDDGRPYVYEKPAIANREFITNFELFLQEIWFSIANAQNTSGENRSDPAAIADLALRLGNMLNERRGGFALGPNLVYEEFAAIAAMSWLYLAIDSNNAVVDDLKARAASPAERLRKIGDRVGILPHAHSQSYFILAPLVSRLLIELEAGLYTTIGAVQAFYLPAPPAANPLRDRLLQIIDHWSRATGRNLKARPGATYPASGFQAPVPTGFPSARASVATQGAPAAKPPVPVGGA
jgi:hypothetical protein